MAKRNKKISQAEKASSRKIPKSIEEPQSFMRNFPVWSFKRLDDGYSKWGLAQSGDLMNNVVLKLKSIEGMTWQDIISASGGRSHGTNNHYEDVSDLIPEAQERWNALHYDDYDKIFSLRLTGTHRLYGILEEGIFYIVWLDQNHEIYPLEK